MARPGREARTSGSECQRVNHYATEMNYSCAVLMLATQPESRAVKKQERQCSVGSVSCTSQGHLDSAPDDCAATQQRVDKTNTSYESVAASSSL